MKFLAFEVKGDREEALTFLSDRLQELGYVKQLYKESLLEREQNHPTGLELSNSVSVAIPHTDTEFANDDVFVIGVPKNEIDFFRIDDTSKSISVDLIFLFVIKDPQKYLKFLSELTENFANADFLELIKSKDLDKIKLFLEKNVFNSLESKVS
ncbi:MAG: PTS sugar transporter subunit IIA [Caldisericaceae bacterium]